MSLTRRPDGTYEGLWRRKGMRPLHLSLRTTKKADAKARHDAIQNAVRAGRYALIDQLRSGEATVEQVAAMVANNEPLIAVVPPVAVTVDAAPEAELLQESDASLWETIDDAIDRYLDWLNAHPNRTDATKANAGFQIARFREFVWEGKRIGSIALDRLPAAAVQEYQASMINAGTSPNTITVYMGRVSTLWSWSIETEQRESREQRRPARELFSPVIADMLHRKKRPRERMLTIDEADRLLASTPPQLLWFVGCGLFAGLRAGETLHLRPGIDVDVEIGGISIREQADWKPKTNRSKRFVPMAPSLLAIAREHATKYANESWMMPSPVHSALPITDLAVRKHFIPIVERAGMIYGREHPQGVTYHTLRHSFASHAVMRGVDLYTVAKLLGDSLKTVEDVYADLSPDHKRTAVAKLAGAFKLPEFNSNDTAGVTANEPK